MWRGPPVRDLIPRGPGVHATLACGGDLRSPISSSACGGDLRSPISSPVDRRSTPRSSLQQLQPEACFPAEVANLRHGLYRYRPMRITMLTLAAAVSSATAAPAGANYDESKMPAYTLPDPL